MTANRIVVGVDGSSGSADALEWCASFARDLDAEVVVVHAVALAEYPELIRAPSADAAWRKELEATVRGIWSKPLQDAGVAFRVVLIDDVAPPALMRIADDEDALSIVVGTRGRGGFKGAASRQRRPSAGTSLRPSRHDRSAITVVREASAVLGKANEPTVSRLGTSDTGMRQPPDDSTAEGPSEQDDWTIDEAGVESFPASDPPSWWPGSKDGAGESKAATSSPYETVHRAPRGAPTGA